MSRARRKICVVIKASLIKKKGRFCKIRNREIVINNFEWKAMK